MTIVVPHGHHVLSDNIFRRAARDILEQPLFDSLGVEDGLCSGEGLGHDHHQRLLGLGSGQRARHIHGVHVGEEAQRSALRGLATDAVSLQRLEDELRAEVRTPDTY